MEHRTRRCCGGNWLFQVERRLSILPTLPTMNVLQWWVAEGHSPHVLDQCNMIGMPIWEYTGLFKTGYWCTRQCVSPKLATLNKIVLLIVTEVALFFPTVLLLSLLSTVIKIWNITSFCMIPIYHLFPAF